MNISKASMQLFASNGMVAAISFVALIYFTRELPSEALGSFFLFQAILGLLSIPASFGLLGAVEKRISEDDAPERVLTTAFLLQLVPLSIIIIVVLAFRSQVNAYLNAELTIWIVVGLIFRTSKELMIKVLRGEMRVGETASLQLAVKAIWALLGSVLVTLGYSTEGLVYSLLIAFFIVFLWGMYKRSTAFGVPSWKKARSLFNFAKFNVVSAVGSYAYNWVDVAVLGLFVSPALVSAYEVAWRLSALLMLFSNAIATSLFPQVSAWDRDEERERIEATVPRMVLFALVFVVPGFFGITIFSQEILRLVFTPEYAVAGIALILLSAERIFHSIHTILGRTLLAVDKPRLAAQATLISLVINIALNIILIWQFGIVGAALATGISFTVNMGLHAQYLSRFLTLSFPFPELGWLFVSSLVMSVLLVIIKQFIAVNALPDLFAVVAFGAAIYFVILLLKTSIRAEFKREFANLTM